MRTATTDADELIVLADQMMQDRFGLAEGEFIDKVVVNAMFAPDLGKSFFQVDNDTYMQQCDVYGLLEMAHHIALAYQLDEDGNSIKAYQSVLDAHRSYSNAVNFMIILSPLTDKAQRTAKLQGLRHLKTKETAAYAVQLFKEGKFRSAHHASVELKDRVLKHAQSKGQSFSEDRIQKTLHGWLRKAENDENVDASD